MPRSMMIPLFIFTFIATLFSKAEPCERVIFKEGFYLDYGKSFVEVNCESKMKGKQKEKLTLILSVVEGYAADYAKAHDMKVEGKMPREIHIEDGPVLKEKCGSMPGRDLLGIYYSSGLVKFVRDDWHTLFHELAHALFQEQASHDKPETTLVCEKFADYCMDRLKREKKKEEQKQEKPKCESVRR